MAAKYYCGSSTSGKSMDGYTFVFEAVDVIAGNWMGVYKAEDEGEQVALGKLASDGQIKEVPESTYNDLLKKKAERQQSSPNMSGVSEIQGAARAAEPAPKEQVEVEEDILEVKQVAKPKRKSKAPAKPSGNSTD